MPTLTRYVSRLFIAHLVVMLFGLVALVQLLDLLHNADKIIKAHGDNPLTVFHYAALRLPELVTFLLPFSVLLASLMTLAKLAQYNEVLALKASGVSYYKILLAFIPATAAVAGLHLLMSDQLAPITSRLLRDWAVDIRDFSGSRRQIDDEGGVWVRDGDDVVRVAAVLRDGSSLENVIMFGRDEEGLLTERISAQRANYEELQWRLFGVEKLSVGDRVRGNFVHFDVMVWNTTLTPGHFADLSVPPSALSLRELLGFVANPSISSQPEHYYRTWLFKRLAVPIASFLMILLAAPVAQGMQRHGGIAAGMAVGIGLGFLYFVTDGVVLAFGEVGTVPPILAVWSPALVFASIGGAALIRMEGY